MQTNGNANKWPVKILPVEGLCDLSAAPVQWVCPQTVALWHGVKAVVALACRNPSDRNNWRRGGTVRRFD